MPELKILFFAKARELVGAESGFITLANTSITIKDITKTIFKTYPNLQIFGDSGFILAFNEEYQDLDSLDVIEVKNGDEVAIIPPISGG